MRNLILCLLAVLFYLSLVAAETPAVTQKMPDFKLPDINSKDITLTSLLNKGPVLVDFWASWCVPCKKEMAALEKLAEKYDTLTVVVVSIDAPKDVQKAKTYVKSNKFRFVSLYDSDKGLASKLNMVNPPRTLILDNQGNIVLSHDGYEAGVEKVYENKIRSMLNLPELMDESAKPDSTGQACTPGMKCGECK